MYGLKAQKFLAQGNGYKQHALKGQKLLAQGRALGCLRRYPVALQGRVFKIRLKFGTFFSRIIGLTN